MSEDPSPSCLSYTHLYGGSEGVADAALGPRGERELASSLTVLEGQGQGLSAEDLQCGHLPLNTGHMQLLPGGHKQLAAGMAPRQGSDVLL